MQCECSLFYIPPLGYSADFAPSELLAGGVLAEFCQNTQRWQPDISCTHHSYPVQD